jgi:hypothetical protein
MDQDRETKCRVVPKRRSSAKRPETKSQNGAHAKALAILGMFLTSSLALEGFAQDNIFFQHAANSTHSSACKVQHMARTSCYHTTSAKGIQLAKQAQAQRRRSAPCDDGRQACCWRMASSMRRIA